MAKRLLIIIGAILLSNSLLYAQSVSYQLISSENISPAVIRLTLVVFSKSKKNVDSDAQKAAIKIVLFNGCPTTTYTRPLAEDGERTSFEKHPEYFTQLLTNRFSDFISNYIPTSKFKKANKQKGTSYQVDVKALQLRKDLEKNKIKRRLGI